MGTWVIYAEDSPEGEVRLVEELFLRVDSYLLIQPHPDIPGGWIVVIPRGVPLFESPPQDHTYFAKLPIRPGTERDREVIRAALAVIFTPKEDLE